ncbi:actin-6-like [Amphiura filiformis]|uniref:actin-6-like n=1 Tax=Amphiura filiformis TaxID=82378 RepID=UPI003B2208D3
MASKRTETDVVPVVIDNGSHTMKVGFAGEDKPRDVFQTASIGNQMKMISPIDRGVITNWEVMEETWRRAYDDKLHVASENHPVLLTERPYNPKVMKEKTYEMMFETFQVPSLYLAIQGVLSLYTSGRTTGLIVDSGDGVTQFVPIHEGNLVQNAVLIDTSLAGLDITEYLEKLLKDRGIHIDLGNGTAKEDILRDIKEKLCYVCTDDFVTHSKLTKKEIEKAYRLPDGSTITLDRERTQCPESLFKPTLLGTDAFGMSDSCYNTIDRCINTDLHPILYRNIILAGGNTAFRGFQERLQAELLEFAPLALAIKDVSVDGSLDRVHAAWCGGAILGSSSVFSEWLITKEEYEEKGASYLC